MMKEQQPKIMIVDDCSVMRSLLRNLLRAENYAVVAEASNAEVALELMKKVTPDIICLDIRMPNVSGLDLLKEIKAEHPHIHVLMITANSDKESVVEAISNGASGFVVKPFSSNKIMTALNKVKAKISEEPNSNNPQSVHKEMDHQEAKEMGEVLDTLPDNPELT